jgi:hypothetical protein
LDSVYFIVDLGGILYLKTALVIQGPMKSTGVAGNYSGTVRNASITDIVDFDTSNYIKTNVMNAKNIFDILILSIWNSDFEKIQDKDFLKIENVKIILNDDFAEKDELKLRNNFLALKFPSFASNNMNKQWVSTNSGVAAAMELGATYCFKIRTDQLIDIKLLAETLISHANSQNKNKIIVPFCDFRKPWALPDFYLGGKCYLLERLTYSLLYSPVKNFSQNVHDQLFFGGSYFLNDNRRDNWTTYIKKENNFSERQKQIIINSWDDIWQIGPEKLFKSLVWRGQPIEFAHYNAYFENDNLTKTISENLSLNNKSNLNHDMIIKNYFPRYIQFSKIKRVIIKFTILSLQKLFRIYS